MSRILQSILIAALVALAVPTVAAEATTTPGVIVFESARDGNDEIYIMNADGTGVRNLTNDPSRDFNPAISRDGSKIVFASERSGNYDLWVMDTDGSRVRRITSGDDYDWNPSWSPDGRKVAFLRYTSEGNYEIFSVSADGGRAKNLTNSPALDAQPSFTTDGRILFIRDYDIWSMTTNGTQLKRLTNDGATNEWPHMSPNGSRIVFHSTRAGSYDIWSMKPNGQDLRQLTSDPDAEAWPTWSPDGTKIVFGWQGDLATVNADGTGFARLSTGGTCDGVGGDVPTWGPGSTPIDPPPPPPDPSNAVLVFQSDASSATDVWVVEADGSNPVNLTGGDCWVDAAPRWSPDGQRIAFSSDRSGSSQIHVMDADGSHMSQLTSLESNGSNNNNPVWSPDGAHIAFSGDGPDGSAPGVWVMNADGTDARWISEGFATDWSGDGRILLHKTDWPLSVWSVRPDGTDPVRHTSDDVSASDAVWSPEEGRIVMSMFDPVGYGYDLAIMASDGSGLTSLDTDGPDSQYDQWPSWAGGHTIAFTSNRGELSGGLFLIDDDGSGVRVLMDTPANESRPDWRPTG